MSRTALVLILLASTAVGQGLRDSEGFQRRLAARAVRELPGVGKIFATPRSITTHGSSNTIVDFLYCQAEPRRQVDFPKVVANIKYTRNPRRPYVENETKGKVPYYWFASGVRISIVAPASGGLRGRNVPSGPEIVARYNREWAERHRRNNTPGQARTVQAVVTKRWFLGSIPSDLRTIIDEEFFAVHHPRDYLGAKGELINYRNRGTHQGPPVEYYCQFLFAVAHGDFSNKIEAIVLLPVGTRQVRLSLHWEEQRTRGVQERLMEVGEADRIMRALVRMAYEELGLPIPGPTPDPVPDPTPDPTPDPIPDPTPDPTPDPDPQPDPVPAGPATGTPSSALPDAPGSPSARIAEMIDVLAPLETDLQAGLIKIKVISDAVKELRARILLDQRLLTGNNPLNKDLIREELAELRKQLKPMHRYLDRQIEVTMSLLDTSVARIEELHALGGYGELTNHADMVLRAARDRRDLLEGQIHLMTGKHDRLRAFTKRLRGEVGGTAKAHFFEALASLREGSPLHALQSLRDARGFGFRTGAGAAPGTTSTTYGATMSGETVEMLQRELEIQILEGLQAQATGSRDYFERDFFDETNRRAEADTERGVLGTWFKRLFRTGLYDATEGAAGRFQEYFTGDSTLRAREQEIGVLGDEVAKTHIALGTLKGLRRAGLQLTDVVKMDRNAFRAAVQEAWGTRVSGIEADRLRRVVHQYGLTQPAVRKLASGEDLTEPRALSGEVVQALEGPLWARMAGWGKIATNMVDGWILATTLAPAARLGAVGGAAKSKVMLAEYFGSSGAAQRAVAGLSKSRMGRRALATSQRVHNFADSSTSRTVRVFVYEAAANGLVSHAVRQQFGEEAQMALDLVQATGVTSSRFWGNAMQKARLSATQVRNASQRMLDSARRVDADLQEASRAGRKLERALSRAGEGTPDAAVLNQVRRSLQELDALPEATSRRLLSAVEDASSGRMASAGENLKAAHRTIQRFTKGTKAARTNAATMRDAAEEMLDDLPAKTTLEVEALEAAGPTVRPGTAPVEHHSPRLLTQDPTAPTHRADVLMAKGDFAGARAEYAHVRTLINAGRVDKTLGPVLNKKMDWAEAAEKAATLRRPPPAGAARAMNAEDAALVRTAILNTEDPDVAIEILKGAHRPHLEGVGKGVSGKSYVIEYARDPRGRVMRTPEGKPMYRRVAVVKELADDDLEGWAEEIASRVLERAGKRGPHTRIVELDIRGTTKRFLVTKTFEPGVDMEDLAPGFADLIAHKSDLADDLAYRMVLGDGDVHLGNFRVFDDGSAMGFDYGGADLFPAHPRYRQPGDFERAVDEIQGIRNRLRELLADPARHGVDAAAAKEASEAVERAARALGVDPPAPGQALDYTPMREAMKEVAQMERALMKVGDSRLLGADFDDLFGDAYVRGLYQHPGFKGNPLDYTDDELRRWVEATMDNHYNHAVNQWGDSPGIVRSAMGPEDFAPALEKLERNVLPNIDEIVDTTMRGASEAERAFTKKLMRMRIQALEGYINRKFPKIPSTGRLGGPRRLERAA